MKKIIIPVIIIFVISACHNNYYKRLQEEDNANYKKRLSYFCDSLVIHFPEKLKLGNYNSYNNIQYKDSLKRLLTEFSDSRYFCEIHYDSIEYKEREKYYEQLKQKELSVNDNNLWLIVDDGGEPINTPYYMNEQYSNFSLLDELIEHNKSIKNGYPVPFFEIEEYKAKTLCNLNENFTLYILGYGTGKFLADGYLYECPYLPNEWKHGYSRGVAVNDKENIIIYWITVW